MIEAASGVLDTSTVILLGRLVDPRALPDEPVISAVTLAELSVGPLLTDDETERSARLAHLQQAESDFEPLPFDAASARAFGRVAAAPRKSGRKPAARAFDALIAATAICRGTAAVHLQPRRFQRDSRNSTFAQCHIPTGADHDGRSILTDQGAGE